MYRLNKKRGKKGDLMGRKQSWRRKASEISWSDSEGGNLNGTSCARGKTSSRLLSLRCCFLVGENNSDDYDEEEIVRERVRVNGRLICKDINVMLIFIRM